MKRLLFALLVAGCGNPAPAGNDLAVPVDAAVAHDLAGTCQPGCGGLTPKCNASGHCVGCLVDADCGAGTYCKIASDTSAACVPGCASDANCAMNGGKCCGGRCVDTATDGANCGGCGTSCMGTHSLASCVGGKCMAGACASGWGDCNNDPKDGCETNLHADPANCTACGMACNIKNAYAGCADGCYAAACHFGYDDCNMNPMDGCETQTSADPKNCGTCGTSCNFANAMAGCVNGNCVLNACTAGYADCNGVTKDGCEINIYTDGNNCGKCGSVCAQGLVCKNGGCTCPNCNFPNASSKCVNNVCMLDQCNQGYGNCDGNAANGCETNLLFDNNNCTACGKACPQGLFCVNGVCGQQALPCSMVATQWCNMKGWKVQAWATAFPNQPGGAIYCTSGVSAANDCDTCATYNELVWKATAKDACSSGEMLVPGTIYAGHSPCICSPNLLNCGQWPMNNCMPD